MKRSFSLISGILLIGLVACGTQTPANPDGGTLNADLAGTPNTDSNLCKGPGCIGAPCTQDLDCTEGSTGAANDLATATSLATKMVREYGLSDELGPVTEKSFLLPGTSQVAAGYAVYGPDQVTQAGNGYITTAVLLQPEQFARPQGGGAQSENSGNVATVSATARMPVAYSATASWTQDGAVSTVSVKPAGEALVFTQNGWKVELEHGRRFMVDLSTLIGGQLLSVTLEDGSAVPAWLLVSLEARALSGEVPASWSAPTKLKLRWQQAGQADVVETVVVLDRAAAVQ